MLWLWIPRSFCIHRHRTMYQKVPSSGPCKNNATRIKLVLSLWICNQIHTLRSQPGHIHFMSGSESESISQSELAHLGSPPDALDDMLNALHTHFGRRCSGDCTSGRFRMPEWSKWNASAYLQMVISACSVVQCLPKLPTIDHCMILSVLRLLRWISEHSKICHTF